MASTHLQHRDPCYIIQVQPDWNIPIDAQQYQTPNTTVTNCVKLHGTNNESIDLQMPVASCDQQFWMNIVRIDDNNEQSTIYQNIGVNYPSHTKQLPTLSSEAFDISNFTQIPVSTSKHSTSQPNKNGKENDEIGTYTNIYSFNLSKSIPQRGSILDTRVISSYSHFSSLHKNINDSQRYQQSQATLQNSENLRLLPGDLADDDPSLFAHLTTNGSKDFEEMSLLLKHNYSAVDGEFEKYTHVVREKYSQHIPIVRCIAVNPYDSDTILSGAENGDLRVWRHSCVPLLSSDGIITSVSIPIPKPDSVTKNVLYGNHIKGNQPHCGDITSTIWLHNGALCLSSSLDTTIKLWAPEYNTCVKTFTGHTRSVTKVIQHPTKPSQFVSVSADGNLFVYDTLRKDAVNNIINKINIIPTEFIDLDKITDVLFFTPKVAQNDPKNTQNNDIVLVSTENVVYYLDITKKYSDFNDVRQNEFFVLRKHLNSNIQDKISTLCIDTPSNTIYIGSQKGMLIVLSQFLNISLTTENGIPEEDETDREPNATHTAALVSYHLYDDAITALSCVDDLLYLTTFQGDCAAIRVVVDDNKPSIEMKYVFTGTEQPLRCLNVHKVAVKGDSSDVTFTRVMAGGDEGIFSWIVV